jgi:hypothetical protein
MEEVAGELSTTIAVGCQVLREPQEGGKGEKYFCHISGLMEDSTKQPIIQWSFLFPVLELVKHKVFCH